MKIYLSTQENSSTEEKTATGSVADTMGEKLVRKNQLNVTTI